MRFGLAVALVCGACSFRPGGATSGATSPDGGHADGAVDAMVSPDAPPPAIAFVQGSGDVPDSDSFTSATFAPQTKGDLNLVVVSWIGTATATASDTDGNTYTLVGSGFSNADDWTELAFYATDIRGGSAANTVSVQLANVNNLDNLELRLLEYTGLATSDPVDATAWGTGTGMAVASGAAATTHARDVIVGVDFLGAGIAALGSGFTTRVDTFGNTAFDMVVGDAGSYDATLTQNKNDEWVMLLIALEGAP